MSATLQVAKGLGTHVIITFDLDKIGLDKIRPMKLKVMAGGASWCREENGVHTLGKHDVTPGDYGWLLPAPAPQA